MIRDEYIIEATKILKKYITIKKSKEWEIVITKNYTTLYKLIIPDICDFPAYLIKTIINKSKDEITKKVWNNSIDDAKK